MVARRFWLWLSIVWLTEAVVAQRTTAICDSGSPCRCTVGKLICDCSASFLKEVLLKKSLLDVFSFSSISITNCFHTHIAADALSGLPALQQVSIANVKQLTLEEKAFDWSTTDPHISGLSINISNCLIQDIPSYSFQGFIGDIVLSSVNISRVRAYAFSSIDHAEKLELNKVNIKEIETQAFKRISMEFMNSVDSNFGVFPERTMIDVTVHQEVRFDRVKINRMEMSALNIHSPRNFKLKQCNIGYIESNAFKVQTKGDVSIHDNSFFHLEKNAFAGFEVESKYLKEAGRQDLVFENNTIVEFENGSLKLNTTSFDPILDLIMIKQKCTCDRAESWADQLIIFSSYPSPKGNHPKVDKLVFCENFKPMSIADFRRLSCNVGKSSILVKVVAAAAVLIVLTVIGVVVYCGIKKRGKRYINVPTSASALRPPEVNKAHMLVVPDGKTYRETELHVIVEHAEPIKTTDYVRDQRDKRSND